MVKYLSKKEILEAQDIASEAVDVPEWGGPVLVWGLTGHERSMWQDWILVRNSNGRGKINFQADLIDIEAKLVALSIKDEDGNRLFTDKDITALGKKSSLALSRVADVARRLSGLDEEDVEDLAKNSVSGQNGDSGSV